MVRMAVKVYEDVHDETIINSKYIKRFKIKAKPSGREWEEGNSKELLKINPSLSQLFQNKLK